MLKPIKQYDTLTTILIGSIAGACKGKISTKKITEATLEALCSFLEAKSQKGELTQDALHKYIVEALEKYIEMRDSYKALDK